jgi:hypothetical protein
MEAARVIVLGIALVTGGIAACLAGPSPLRTVDALIARGDIGMRTAVSASDPTKQARPAAITGARQPSKTAATATPASIRFDTA